MKRKKEFKAKSISQNFSFEETRRIVLRKHQNATSRDLRRIRELASLNLALLYILFGVTGEKAFILSYLAAVFAYWKNEGVSFESLRKEVVKYSKLLLQEDFSELDNFLNEYEKYSEKKVDELDVDYDPFFRIDCKQLLLVQRSYVLRALNFDNSLLRMGTLLLKYNGKYSLKEIARREEIEIKTFRKDIKRFRRRLTKKDGSQLEPSLALNFRLKKPVVKQGAKQAEEEWAIREILDEIAEELNCADNRGIDPSTIPNHEPKKNGTLFSV